ncbi:hypothetical protein O9K51_04898 [Purpureocillium lavendulum]|uniref:Uncharacterized protein n=1 Tax=Purpureocillium lavendulum TaxID=1247861 RepID=A0AB34FR22_9HYPO|nr:hypothetical protein O9K51_04898 [Purpureocillium lavendulum]
MNHVDLHSPVVAGEKPASAGAPTRGSRADVHAPWDRLDCIAGSDLASCQSAVHPPRHSPRDALAQEPQPDFWEAPGDGSVFFGDPSIEQNAAPSEEGLVLVDQPSNPSQLQGLLGADVALDAILHAGPASSTALNMDIDPLLDPWEGVLPPRSLAQCFSAGSSLMRFREEMDQRIAAVDSFFLNPLKVLQSCKEEGSEAGNPASLLLTSSQEFMDIIQSLTAAARPTHLGDPYTRTQLVPPPDSTSATHIQTEDALSTEIVLLALSSYLALMRLYDSLFHCVYKCLCQMPTDSFKSVKVKSVLRIGGISSLQDMPLKTYATGILDAVHGQVRTLERCMGIPAEYCLSRESTASHTAAAPGLFSRADRARLFCAVMAQEDVKARRGSMSYIESIRTSIQDSVAFLEG